MGFSHYALQKAIFTALSTDFQLMEMVSGIHDRPPQETAFPYITLGEATGKDWSSKTTRGMEYQLTLHSWSREGGRKQAALIMQRIHAVLHHADLTVEGQKLVMLKFAGSQIVLENDGWTYRGSMHFRALLETAA